VPALASEPTNENAPIMEEEQEFNKLSYFQDTIFKFI